MSQTSVFLSADMVEEKYRNDFWSALLTPVMEPSLVEGQGGRLFHGTIESRPMGSLAIGATSFNAQRYLRAKKHIIKSDIDQYLLQLFTSGSLLGDFDGNDVSVRAGDICIGDNLRPIKSQTTIGSTISVAIPRSMVEANIRGRLHGVVLRAENPTTRLLSDFIRSLYALKEPQKPEVISQIEDAFATLLSASVSSLPGENEPLERYSSKILRERILSFVDTNLEHADLSVTSLMQQFGVSRAHLYRVFAEDGGVAKIIRDRRLDAAYKALLTAKLSQQSLEELSYRFGFANYSQFARAFQARFGSTPGSVRTESRIVGGAVRRANQIHQHFKYFQEEYGETMSNQCL
jgi:AraC-like DNA-binding protein